MGSVDTSGAPLHPAGGKAIAPEGTAAKSARVVKKTVAQAPATVLYLLSYISRFSGATLTQSKDLLEVFAGGAYLTSAAVDKLLQGPDFLLKVAALETAFKALEAGTRETMIASLQHAQEVRDQQGDMAEAAKMASDATISVAKKGGKMAAGLIPGAATVVELFEAGMDVASWLTNAAATIEKAEAKVARANLSTARSVAPAMMTLCKMILETGLRVAAPAAKLARYPVGYLKDRSFALWSHGEAPGETLLNLSDWLESCAYRVSHCYDAVHLPQQEKVKKRIDIEKESTKVTPDEIERFNQKTPDALKDLLFLISNHPAHKLTRGEIGTYRQEIANHLEHPEEIPDDIKRALIVLENKLPPETKSLLVPSLFDKMSPAEKFKIFQFVSKLGSLKAEERKFLGTIHVGSPEDFESLTLDQMEKLRWLLTTKFNQLGKSDKERLRELSVDQFKELDQATQNQLLKAIQQRVIESLEKAPKGKKSALEEARQKLQPLIEKTEKDPLKEQREIKIALNIFKEHFKGEDYTAILESVKIKAWMEQEELKRRNPQEMQLAEEENRYAFSEGAPLDPAKIDEMVGLHVGPARRAGEAVGYAPRIALEIVGRVAALPFDVVGYAIKPHGIEVNKDLWPEALLTTKEVNGEIRYILKGSERCSSLANWLTETGGAIILGLGEMAFNVRFVQQFTLCYLAEQGVPLQVAEDFLRQAPAAAYSIGISLLAAARTGLAAVDYSSWLIKQLADIEAVAKLSEITKEQETAQRGIDWANKNLPEIITGLCKGHENNELLGFSPAPNPEEWWCDEKVYTLLTHPEFGKKMNEMLGLKPEEAKFVDEVFRHLKALVPPKSMAGQAAELAKNIAVTPAVAAREVARATYETASAIATPILHYAGNVAETVKNGVGSLLASTAQWMGFGQTAEVVSEAIAEPLQEVYNTVAEAVSSAATTTSEAFEDMPKIVAGMVDTAQEVIGIRQPIPAEVEEAIKHISETHAAMAHLKAMKEAAETAQASLNQLSATWFGSALRVALETPELRPYADTIIAFMRGAGSLATASAVLEAIAKDSAEKLGQQLNAQAPGAIAHEAIDASLKSLEETFASSIPNAPGAVKDVAQAGLSTLGVLGSAVGITTSSYVAVPIAMRHTLFPLLRLAIRRRDVAQSAFYGIAARVRGIGRAAGKMTEETIKTMGGAAQYAFNYMVRGKVVLQERINNFTRLDAEERKHIVQLALQCGSISEEDKKALEEYQPRGDKEYQRGIAKRALKLYDQLTPDELLSVSESYFLQLDPMQQGRIIDVVTRKAGLSATERKDVKAIVQKFNALSPEQKKAINIFSPWEFSQYNADEQEDILFRIVNSSAYSDYKKVRNPKTAWRIEEFQRLKRLPHAELKKVLALYTTIDPLEMGLMTPSEMRRLADAHQNARLGNMVSTVTTYNAPGADTIKRALGEGYAIDGLQNELKTPTDQKKRNKMLEALAFSCTGIREHQQHYLLLFTKEEFSELKPDDKLDLIRFLLAQPLDERQKLNLRRQFADIERGKVGDAAYIVKAFNALSVELQAEFREIASQNLDKDTEFHASVHKELEGLRIKLQFITQEKEKQASKLLGLQLRMEKTEKEAASLPPESEARKRLTAQLMRDQKMVHEIGTLISHLGNQIDELKIEFATNAKLLPDEGRRKALESLQLRDTIYSPQQIQQIQTVSRINAQIYAEASEKAALKNLEDPNKKLEEDRDNLKNTTRLFKGIIKEFQSERAKVLQEAEEIERESKNEQRTPEERTQLRYRAAYLREFKAELYNCFIKESTERLTSFKEKAQEILATKHARR